MPESTFVRLHAIDFPRSWRAKLRLLGAAGIGGLMLLTPYSATMGVLVIAISGFLLALPALSRSRMRRRYAETRYLRGNVTYGVSGRGFWLAGDQLSAESSWRGLKRCEERFGLLILTASGMPPVYLPLDEIRARDLYLPIIALARLYGHKPVRRTN